MIITWLVVFVFRIFTVFAHRPGTILVTTLSGLEVVGYHTCNRLTPTTRVLIRINKRVLEYNCITNRQRRPQGGPGGAMAPLRFFQCLYIRV